MAAPARADGDGAARGRAAPEAVPTGRRFASMTGPPTRRPTRRFNRGYAATSSICWGPCARTSPWPTSPRTGWTSATTSTGRVRPSYCSTARARRGARTSPRSCRCSAAASTCYLPDARGHATTRWDAADGFRYDWLVDDLEAFADALGAGDIPPARVLDGLRDGAAVRGEAAGAAPVARRRRDLAASRAAGVGRAADDGPGVHPRDPRWAAELRAATIPCRARAPGSG